MTRSFNLTDEPWLPCETADGTTVLVGLREALVRAHELRALYDASPLVTASLHRLLLAVVHRCFGPPNLPQWKVLYRVKRFDPRAINAYFHQWWARFDLFDPERPFYQVAGLPFEPDPPSRLVFERSNYGAPVHVFQHRDPDIGDRLTPARAARCLVALQSFAPGGLVRKRGEPDSASAAPLNRGAVVLVSGESLFETLMLNLVVYSPDEGTPVPSDPSRPDMPAWERSAPPRIERRTPDGWLDLLTWQSRRLELTTDNEGTVTGIIYCVGVDLADEGLQDPMVAWVKHEKRGYVPVEFDEDRAVWRDSDALFRATGTAEGTREVRRPLALTQIAAARDVVPQDRRFSIDLLGMRGDQARILMVRSERVPIRSQILADPNLGKDIADMLVLSESGANALKMAVRTLVRSALGPGERRPDERKDVIPMADALGAEATYWAALRQPFEEFLDRLAEDEEGARGAFAREIRNHAQRSFARVRNALGDTPRALKGATWADQELWRGLSRVRSVLEAKEEHRS